MARCLICQKNLYRNEAHPHKGKVLTGFYCANCGIVYSVDLVPCINVSVFVALDPELGKLDPSIVYPIILDLLKNPEKISLPSQRKDPIASGVCSILEVFCRDRKKEDPAAPTNTDLGFA